MRVLITGGAGFIGSSLARRLKADHGGWQVTTLDNLVRRGSETAVAGLESAGVAFVHGDIRIAQDIEAAGPFDLLVHCSAEPSVHAGYGGSASYLLNTNLLGTANCLEAARGHRAAIVLMSSSRVYPMGALRGLPLEPRGTRLQLRPGSSGEGWSLRGISTDFPLGGARSLYGATKLCAEHLVEEYGAAYGLRTVVNRCGVVTGPCQMGKVEQGFAALWAARHLFGGRLQYRGFGGEGLQVRDLLHIADLCDLIDAQIGDLATHDGQVFNVGGGMTGSVSLAEMTKLCETASGKRVDITSVPETDPADIPYYVTDNARVTESTGWEPRRGVERIVEDLMAWLRENADTLRPIMG